MTKPEKRKENTVTATINNYDGQRLVRGLMFKTYSIAEQATFRIETEKVGCKDSQHRLTKDERIE